MTTWEYVIERATVVERWSSKRQAEEVEAFQRRLNEFGTAGWEMISFETVPLTGAFSGNIKGLHLFSVLQASDDRRNGAEPAHVGHKLPLAVKAPSDWPIPNQVAGSGVGG